MRNPAIDAWRTSMAFAMMLAEAQAVIGLRLLGLAGVWAIGPDEHRRMWAEKVDAARLGGLAAMRAAAAGAAPARVAAAALNPVRRRTRANVRRLTRRAVQP